MTDTRLFDLTAANTIRDIAKTLATSVRLQCYDTVVKQANGTQTVAEAYKIEVRLVHAATDNAEIVIFDKATSEKEIKAAIKVAQKSLKAEAAATKARRATGCFLNRS